MAEEKIFIQPFLGFAKGKKPDFRPMFLDGVINQFYNLLAANPAVRMKNEVQHALLEHGGVQGGFPVGDRGRVVDPMKVLGVPITGHQGGEFPTELSDHVRIRIVCDGGREGRERNVFAEFLAAIEFSNQLPRE